MPSVSPCLIYCSRGCVQCNVGLDVSWCSLDMSNHCPGLALISIIIFLVCLSAVPICLTAILDCSDIVLMCSIAILCWYVKVESSYVIYPSLCVLTVWYVIWPSLWASEQFFMSYGHLDKYHYGHLGMV